MKKIFKLLPLAFVGLALASCQSDEFDLASEAKHNPNALKIVAEGLEDGDYVTRAGAVSASSLKSTTMKWNTNDVIRVYDATLSMWDKYTFSGAEFSDATADFVPAPNNSLTSFSLGAFPSKQVESAYLDKDDKTIKHLEMTVPDFYDYTEKTFDDLTVGYRSDLPMYGNITGLGEAVSEMNYLTSIVRVNIMDVPANTKYLVLVDQSVARQPLAGRFIADIDGINPPVLKTDAKFAAAEYKNGIIAKINPNAFNTTPAAKDSAGIFLPVIANQVYTDLRLYAVVDPTLTLTQIRSDIATGTFAPTDYLQIAQRDWDQPERKKVWWVRYTHTLYIDTDVLTGLYPGHITAALNEHTKSIGELIVKPYSASGGAVKPLNPCAGDQFYHQVIIPKMINGCKVTLDLSKCGVKYDEALQIYRNTEDATLGEFVGDFKIIPGLIDPASTGANTKVEVKLPGSNVEIISDNVPNPLGNIDIQEAAKTTIGDGSTATNLTGKTVTIQAGEAFIKNGVSITGGKLEAKRYAGNANQYPSKITVEGGASVVLLDNNCPCDIDVISTDGNEALITTLDCADVDEAIDIYSEGKANIQEIICPNGNAVAGTGGAQLLTIKSKLTEQATGILAVSSTAATAGTTFGLAAPKPAIYTAAQLVQAVAAGITTADTYIMADEIDLNNLPWVGLTTCSKNFYGYNHDTTTDTWLDGTVNANKVKMTATGKNVIKNMTIDDVNGNGLIKNIDASANAVEIAGIEFTDPQFEGTSINNIGVVAGTVATGAANNIEFTNIKVTGLTVASKAGNGVGGILGAITAAQTGNVNVLNVDVAAPSIAARSFVGGIIGRVAANANINALDSKADLAYLALSLADGVTTLYPTYAGTMASFVGGTEGNPTVVLNIYDCVYGTTISKATKGNGINNQGLRFGANANSSDVPFFGGNPWIGFCGLATGTSNTTLTTYKSIDLTPANKGINFYKYAYAVISMTVSRWNNTTADFAETTQKNLTGGTLYTSGVGANTVTFDGSPALNVAASKVSGSHAWLDGKKYGTTIYSIYNTSALDPDALGYDNVYEPTSF